LSSTTDCLTTAIKDKDKEEEEEGVGAREKRGIRSFPAASLLLLLPWS
jgi:hypothetical protein